MQDPLGLRWLSMLRGTSVRNPTTSNGTLCVGLPPDINQGQGARRWLRRPARARCGRRIPPWSLALLGDRRRQEAETAGARPTAGIHCGASALVGMMALGSLGLLHDSAALAGGPPPSKYSRMMSTGLPAVNMMGVVTSSGSAGLSTK